MSNPQKPSRIPTLEANDEFESFNSCCWWYCNFTKWFGSLLIWGSIIALICDKTLYYIYIILFFSYIFYLSIELSSPTSKFLCSISKKNFEETISDLLNEFPSVSLYSNNGHNITTKEFPYAHCFDETEKIILDKEKIKGKSYIRLKIDVDLYLANDATIKLFNELKSSFIELTKNNNVKILTKLNRYGPKCLIRLENKRCGLINNFWFIFFTVLSFGEIYALILKLISV